MGRTRRQVQGVVVNFARASHSFGQAVMAVETIGFIRYLSNKGP